MYYILYTIYKYYDLYSAIAPQVFFYDFADGGPFQNETQSRFAGYQKPGALFNFADGSWKICGVGDEDVCTAYYVQQTHI